MVGPSVQSCPEPVALPIIFVPGIMGSRLRNRTTGQIVWDPGTNWSTVWGAFTESAAAKRRRLVGPDGAAFRPDFLEVDMGRVGGTLTAERHRRQWGGLMADFYMSFMSWLDMTAEAPATGLVPRGCFNLHYEAWAHPYNWTDDNDVAAQGLARTVSRAVADTQTKYRNRDVRVLKPVVVTHSMGGLVARAYVTNHGGAAALHGVIHGAMPTDGAPATYKRMRAGFEGGWGAAAVTQRVLGQSQAEVTATAGNCPGPLQLLPNARHKSVNGSTDWLRLTNTRGGRLWSRPAANPYSEIYLNRRDWWRLIDQRFLDPGGTPRGDRAWSNFETQLRKAAAFHSALGSGGFHSNTRMFWSNDPDMRAWDTVEWRLTRTGSDPRRNPEDNDQQGRLRWGEWVMPPPMPMAAAMPVFVPEAEASIQGATARGDGTVHAGSGRHVTGPMSVPTRVGFAHDGAFEPGAVRQLVAGWLFEMVQEQL
ncbi:MAG: hypothetical protein NWT12_14790 [Paracoccaceae bacterium]|jgi:hypothetical protein|nr:hypothetical protein [Paracoccaceae bacterium]